MSLIEDVKILELEGTPRERGQIHGEKVKSMIWEYIERWKYHLSTQMHVNPDKYFDNIFEKTHFLDAVKKWSPSLLEEVEGIGEGADVDFKTIFTLQLMDENWWYANRARTQGIYEEQCSALGCFKEDDYPALLAQNGDLRNTYDGFQVLLHIKNSNSSVESYVMAHAGLIGLWGMNNQPLGITCNTLSQLNPSIDGLPVSFIVRAVLEQSTLNKSIKFINEIKHASGQNYIIGDLETVVNFECSANKVSKYIPYEGARKVYHTNHPIVNNDLIVPILPFAGNSHVRFTYLEKRMKDSSRKITVETIKNILSSHEGPICVHNNYQPGGGVTIASLVYVLSSSPELHLAVGPPCSTKWKIYKFE